MFEVILSEKQEFELLHYEQGWSQQHPDYPVIDWMRDQGYVYNTDWFCKPHNSNLNFPYPYRLFFPNEKIMSAFIIRWS